jgi:hypothetical protein
VIAKSPIVKSQSGDSNPIASGLVSALRREISAIDKDQPISRVAMMEQLVTRTLAPQTLSTLLFVAFAMLGLMLSAVGVYGVMATASRSGRTRSASASPSANIPPASSR